jgi:membrane protein DedA with SNARE-associated domain
VLLGYLAGDAWQRIERVQNVVGLAVVTVVVAAIAFFKLRGRWPRHA